MLSLSDVAVAYAGQTVVQNINADIKQGQLVCLLGPSGCGKTTLLRAIAGFEKVSAGSIELAGHIVSSAKQSLPPEKRHIGMVFQDFALFPHLTIAKNITFGIRDQSSKAQQQRVTELLALVDLAGYEDRYPHELSGGQQQRIALARALAPKPKLLLLDEPFASQDVELREMLAREVRQILQQEQVTAILVTHDQHEAFAMADIIGVMQKGQIQQWDTAYNLYHRPVNQFVADFIGEGAMLKGQVIDSNTVNTVLGNVHGDVPKVCRAGCPVDVLIRPDDVFLKPINSGEMSENAPATITAKVFRGAYFLYTLKLNDASRILVLAPSHQNYAIGDQVAFDLDVKHLVILKREQADVV
jgi:iron(III) transport system ATP-binding protein